MGFVGGAGDNDAPREAFSGGKDEEIAKEVRAGGYDEKEEKGDSSRANGTTTVAKVIRVTSQAATVAKNFIVAARASVKAARVESDAATAKWKANQAHYSYEGKPTTERQAEALKGAYQAQQEIENIYKEANGQPLTEAQQNCINENQLVIENYYEGTYDIDNSNTDSTTSEVRYEEIPVDEQTVKSVSSGQEEKKEEEEQAKKAATAMEEHQDFLEDSMIDKSRLVNSADRASEIASAIVAATKQDAESRSTGNQ